MNVFFFVGTIHEFRLESSKTSVLLTPHGPSWGGEGKIGTKRVVISRYNLMSLWC